MADKKETISRLGTARALVLLASGLAAGGAALLCLLTVVLVTKIALATAIFAAFVLVSAIAGTVLTVRARSLRTVIGFGCGTLLAGVIIGLAVMLVLIAHITRNPT